MERKRPKTGLLVLFVAVGAATVGFLVGRIQAPDAAREGRRERPAARPVTLVPEPPPAGERATELADNGFDDPYLEKDAVPDDVPTPSDLIVSLREHAGTERGQIIVLGMVANAARMGSAALPEIRELLRSNADIKLGGYSGQGLGYPSLRVALMAAAEATGDPEAVNLIAEVAQTTESPVEVVFSAHLLDRLDALDADTAQRTLSSLSGQLSPEQKKAMGAVVGRVVPAAAAADPVYAETLLTQQLRMEKGTGADPRFMAPILDGLPGDRAHDLVMSAMTAADVSDRNKRMLVSRAAQRAELSLLSDLRQTIETGVVSPRIASSIAHSAIGGRRYSNMEKRARRAAKAGDFDKARQIAGAYRDRLNEANLTIDAARNAGARLRNDINTYARLRQQRFNAMKAQIAKAYQKKKKAEERAARQAAKN
ncbi:MAG: hypothetical protein ACYTG3_17990 [Planctomycetota bacterium]|jgi:hypothetical protein